ncbi:MAG TPA: hypothetical protein PLD95_02210 [bacterium]|nr:MAG: hypothetical protein BWX59_00853 [Bacteroidetes bacterium ADurb.Bin028]HOG38263.1 hypothetical protein [bacterium]
MKKFLITTLLLVFTLISVNGQNKWKGFWKPVEDDLFTNPEIMTFRGIEDPTRGIWLFKFDAQITAVQLLWSKEKKKFLATPLSSTGLGIGYRHYVQYNSEPYCDFAINLLWLVGFEWNEPTEADFSLASTVTILEYVNIGGGYNFTEKSPLLLMGAIVKF